jgi:hypothetical protein
MLVKVVDEREHAKMQGAREAMSFTPGQISRSPQGVGILRTRFRRSDPE